jgi:hypothetical protein
MQHFLQSDLFLQVSGITPGRAASIISGVIGLISIIIGRLAIIRLATQAKTARVMSIIAIVAALTCIVLAVLQLARTTGGFGTGKGRAGAIVAIVIGCIGLFLGAKALLQFRRFNR